MISESKGRMLTCPVAAYDRAGAGYAESVAEWLANPHAYFRSFGGEARAFQKRHRSERLRTMTLVASADELVKMRPTILCVDEVAVPVESWEQVFSIATSRLMAANPSAFSAMQRDGLLEWMGCSPDAEPVATSLEKGMLCPSFGSLSDVVSRVQWLFLMCGIRLNEVVVQVDPFTDEQWKERKAALDRKRAEDKAFMEGRRAAQKAWAAEHPDDLKVCSSMTLFDAVEPNAVFADVLAAFYDGKRDERTLEMLKGK